MKFFNFIYSKETYALWVKKLLHKDNKLIAKQVVSMIEIKTQNIGNSNIFVPGSKSYTHRLLIAAALSEGECFLYNILKSEDTLLTLGALKQMGVNISEHGDKLSILGSNGKPGPSIDPIYLANSGTSMRLLTGVAALGSGTYLLTGTKRMHERPIQNLLDGMNQIGIQTHSVKGNGCPPVKVEAEPISGGPMELNCSVSSQYLSSILLISPYTKDGLEIQVTKGPVSKPYVDMTLDIMSRFGVQVERRGYKTFKIPGMQKYRAGSYTVEPDCSQAGYFWAAAAVTGTTVKVMNITKDTHQGDVRFAEVLKKMGCSISYENDGIAVTGGPLTGIDIDMADMPDIVPTLAVVASFANGTTRISNVAHLKAKESDRIGSVVKELNRIGIEARGTESGLLVKGGKPRGAEINTYNDHRIAMSFAIAGLIVPGVKIKNETCVEKSFPDFWDVFERLYTPMLHK